MKTRRRNKKRATRRKGGMFAAKRAASTVGSLALEVGKAKAQDIFKEKVKGWENSVNNKENQENIKINNNKPVNSQLYNYQNQL